ncbi:MAG: RNA polymerase sigma factor [Planctomycetes bacterium]|nr:RNA polymerase sigma factor [Planctomycetota bacterium]MBL7145197.1 RNA polymerase sigma factor [Phycisphaerae bacterium]
MKDNLSNIQNHFLVMAAQDGNEAALDKLVSLWQKKLWQYVFRLTTDVHASWDITQQCWLEIIKGLTKLHDPANFKAWAYRIATNRTIDWLKNKKKNQHINLESIEVDSNRKDNDSQVKELVQRLKSDSRVILSLYYFEQLSIPEISIALNIPTGTVKSRLFTAREELKQLWKKYFDN